MTEPRIRVRDDVASLMRRLAAGDRAALSRLLTLAGTGQANAAIASELAALAKFRDKTRPPVVAFTGSGGVGKSSLLGLLTARFAESGERIGVPSAHRAGSSSGFDCPASQMYGEDQKLQCSASRVTLRAVMSARSHSWSVISFNSPGTELGSQ